MKSQAYRDGQQARIQGFSTEDCPYDPFEQKAAFNQWNDGWIDQETEFGKQERSLRSRSRWRMVPAA